MNKVLFIVPFDYEKIGGIRLPVLKYIESLKRHSIQVDLKTISYHPKKKEMDNIFDTNDCRTVVVYGLNQANSVIGYCKRKKTILAFDKLIGLLIDSETLYATSILSSLNPFLSPKRYFMFYLKSKLYRKREKECLLNFTDVLYVSKVDANYVNENFKLITASIHVVENGIVAPKHFRSRNHNYAFFRIGFISTLSKSVVQENLKPLVEIVMPAVLKKFPNAKLVVAGKGGNQHLADYLSRFPYIDYLGPVSSLDLFYEDVDVVVPITLKRNGILNKILEAWSYGKCVIAYSYNFFAFDSALKNKHYLCGENLFEISTIIEDVISQKYDIDSIGLEARKLVINNFSWAEKQDLFLKIVGSNEDN